MSECAEHAAGRDCPVHGPASLPPRSNTDPAHLPTRHERENAARDLARDFVRAVTRGDTRLAWVDEGLWTTAGENEAKFDLIGPDGLTARVTVHVSGGDDG